MRLASFLATVFPHLTGLHLDAVCHTDRHLVLAVTSTRRSARCPDCQRRSRRAHSWFTRTVADVSLGTLPVRLCLHARRYRCVNPACPQQTFRERLPQVVPPYQRRTPLLRQQLEAISFVLGGQAGQRLARHLHLGEQGTSRNTLLRLLHGARMPVASEIAPALRALGVDDFAFRRGRDYGAILVDLDQYRVIDLLPDRDAATFAHWLEQHGGAHVEVLSRDRGGAFADGARQAAPQAMQVADRFHLLQNLGQTLDQLLTREQSVLTRVADSLPHPATADAASSTPEQPLEVEAALASGASEASGTSNAPAASMTRLERQHAMVEARRQARYKQVVTLAEEGHSLREVARRAGLSRGTVRRYLRAGQYQPCAKHARRTHGCDAFSTYLRRRWEEGEHNSAVLLTEIQEQGLTGAASTLRQYVRGWRTGPRHPGRRVAPRIWKGRLRANATTRHARHVGSYCVRSRSWSPTNTPIGRRCVRTVPRLRPRRRLRRTLAGSCGSMPTQSSRRG